jgi:hypothetical protein
MCFGFQSTPKKLITNAKISCPPFNIHKTKHVVVEWHSIKVGKTYNYLVFPTNFGNNSRFYLFIDGNTIIGMNACTKPFQPTTFHEFRGKWFLTIKNPKFSKKIFCYRSFFKEGSFIEKKLDRN